MTCPPGAPKPFAFFRDPQHELNLKGCRRKLHFPPKPTSETLTVDLERQPPTISPANRSRKTGHPGLKSSLFIYQLRNLHLKSAAPELYMTCPAGRVFWPERSASTDARPESHFSLRHLHWTPPSVRCSAENQRLCADPLQTMSGAKPLRIIVQKRSLEAQGSDYMLRTGSQGPPPKPT